ncbi:hypothetical protein BV20DRAFT_1057838 [Pilatotrama ljubarskyi]|nr:hypothetical protein BV20DRAFT_1057838 [Pilatotrama ljubarskyi]
MSSLNQPHGPTPSLDDEAIRQAIVADIAHLKEQVSAILGLFKKVHGAFAAFDHRYLRARPETDQLAFKWKTFWTRFRQYLDDSRKDANAAAAVMSTYSGAILRDISDGIFNADALLHEIQIFRDAVKEKIGVADRVKDNFRGLAEDIEQFEIKVELTLQDLNIPLPAEMTEGRTRMSSLRKYLKLVYEEMTAADANCFVGLGGLIIHSATALYSMVPSLGAKTLWSVRGFGCPSVPDALPSKEVDDTVTKLQQEGKRIVASLDASRVPQGVQTFYRDWWADTKVDIGKVCERINVIGTVWDRLALDLQELEVKLTLCGAGRDTKNIDSLFLQRKITMSRIVFDHLSRCFKMYASQLQT